MKRVFHFSVLALFFITGSVWAQDPMNGGWNLVSVNGQSLGGTETVTICQDGYFMFGQYQSDGAFLNAGGGNYELEGDELRMVYDFFATDNSRVRVPETYEAQLQDNTLTVKGMPGGTQIWERIEEEPTPLSGVWYFATRVDEEGNEGERRRPGTRMTLKILGGGRFQWAAFNYESKEFRGTGGGIYKTQDGTYGEQIEFFSRDDSRVGGVLSFEYSRSGDDWYHKGKSSSGDPLYEVWTKLK